MMFFYSHPIRITLSVQDIEHDMTITEEEARQYVKKAEMVNSIRLKLVEEICWKYNLGLYKHSDIPNTLPHPPTPQYAVFYIDKIHKLSWCPIYKASSSTWLYNLCLLAGYTEENISSSNLQLSELARKVYPELDFGDAEETFLSTIKLLVVRHPFERLLSAYRDKLENINTGQEHGTLHYYKKYGKKIVEKFRKNGNKTHIKDLLKPHQYVWDPALPEPSGLEPTFQEFVRYLLSTDLSVYADDHWIPYYLYCTPCLLKYDIIAKVETLLIDQVNSDVVATILPLKNHNYFKL